MNDGSSVWMKQVILACLRKSEQTHGTFLGKCLDDCTVIFISHCISAIECAAAPPNKQAPTAASHNYYVMVNVVAMHTKVLSVLYSSAMLQTSW